MFEELHTLSTELIDLLINYDTFDKIRGKFKQLNSLTNLKLRPDEKVIKKVSRFLNIECGKELDFTFGDVLKEISTKHIHNAETSRCDYHQESLISHLVVAFMNSMIVVPTSIYSLRRVQFYLLSLFHDIGKFSCQTTYPGEILGFPFHGEHGSGTMLGLWSDSLLEFFKNYDEYTMFCRAIGSHMCGYHCVNYSHPDEIYKLDMISTEKSLVKEYLYWLSYTDKVSGFSKHPFEIESYLKFRPEFQEIISKKKNLNDITKINKLNKGLLILVFTDEDDKFSNFINYFKDCDNVKILIDHSPETFRYEVQGETFIIVKANYYFMESYCLEDFNEYFRVFIDVIKPFYDLKSSLFWLPKCINKITATSASTKKKLIKIITDSSFPHFRIQTSIVTDVIIFNLINNLLKLDNIKSNPVEKKTLKEMVINCINSNSLDNFFRGENFIIKTPRLFSDLDNVTSRYIKYQEGRNQNFLPYARQCRGIIFNIVDNKPIFMKSLLERGMEIVMPEHRKNQVTTNENSKARNLDEDQKNIIRKCAEQAEEDIFVSFKLDGSLTGVILYPIDSYQHQVVEEALNKKQDKYHFKFALDLIQYAKSQNLNFIPLICTQGTLIMPINMLDYFVTAYALSHGYNDIRSQASISDPAQVFNEKYRKKFILQLDDLYKACPEHLRKEAMCISFEAVCENSTTAWHNTCFTKDLEFNIEAKYNGYHPELGINTSKSCFEILGITFNVGEESGSYRAHFQIPDIVKKSGFEEPGFSRLKSTKDLNCMLGSLSELLEDKITERDFFDKYPSLEMNKHSIIHYEGFVVYNKKLNSKEIGLFVKDFDFDVNYSKAKSTEYYKGHGFDKKTVKDLLKLGKTAEKVMPLVKEFKEFNRTLEPKLQEICLEIREWIQELFEIDPNENKLLDQYKVKEKMYISILNKIENKEYKTIFRMFLKISKEFNDVIDESFNKRFIFTKKYIDKKNRIQALLEFINKIKFFEDDYQILINKKVSECDSTIIDLFEMVHSGL
uniref:Uncharacterized protein n=1 Tax=viral metagenome TaxID=1070528 RepID=A0A6C0ACE6_9ZZZZ